MSFGFSIGDVSLLTQVAWNVTQNSRKACGEHDELTQEVSTLHVVLKRLQHEITKPESPINKPADTSREEIEFLAGGCHRVLMILDQIWEKYNALSETERSGRKLWQKIKFGNGQMADLADLRSKVVFYTSAISLFLNMISIGTMGSVEKQMNDAGGDLKEIKQAVNGITAHLVAKDRSEGSVLTAYPDDDRIFWKELRRELIENGFSSFVIKKHRHLIKAYIGELGARGLLDDAEPQVMSGPSARSHFNLADMSHLTTSSDAGSADSQSDITLATEKRIPDIEISIEIDADSPLAPEVQSNTEFPSILDSRSDIESKIQLTQEDIVDAQDPALAAHIKRPRQLKCRETLPIERPNTQHSTTPSYASTQTVYAEKSTGQLGDGSAPNLEGDSAKVEVAVQATNPTHEDNSSLQGTTYPSSPAELISCVSGVWYNEYLLASQYPNIGPSLGTKTTLRTLLLMLNAVDLEAIGWSNELKACRTALIKHINIRLSAVERRSQILRKHHICRPRCFCKLDTSDNAKSIIDADKFCRKLIELSRETYHDESLKSPSPRLSGLRRLEVSEALHRIWHDHYDRVAPLCLGWAKLWGRRIWEQGRFQKLLPMNAECMKLIISMRKNKQHLETLDLDGDVELTARRQQLMEDTKLMVSSMRIFKSDNRWRWESSGISVKRRGKRVCIDISWVNCTIVSSTGAKCGVCSAS